MPRFGLEPDSPETGAALDRYYHSPPPPTNQGGGGGRRASTFQSKAPKQPLLSCLSPDGRSVHIIHGSSIETHALPLAGTTEDVQRVPVICTPLPDIIMNPKDIMELVCIEGDSMPSPETLHDQQTMTILPLLCIYTPYAVYTLKCGYPSDHIHLEQDRVAGQVLDWYQPLEMDIPSSATIIRVRPAPHRRLGYATFCVAGSLAALVVNNTGDGYVVSNEYSLLVYHAKSKTVTVPLTFRTEDVLEESNACDFCFAQSNAQGLLSTLSIHIIKTNGDVFGASPIVFDGSLVPTDVHAQACELIEEFIDEEEAADSAKWRQCKAALHCLDEAFVAQQGSRDFKVLQLHSNNIHRSTLWQVQLQGPIIVVADGQPGDTAACCEPHFCSKLCGLAVAGPGGLQFSVVPPTAVLPRFAFESDDDTIQLQRDQVPGMLVEHIVDLSGATNMVRDPIMNTMLHVISDRGVTTVTSHALAHLSATMHAMPGTAVMEPKPTKAWMAVDLGQNVHVHGAVVTHDAHLGHVLIVYLSTGQLTAINMTETRVRYESTILQQKIAPEHQPKDEALQNMEATLAFHEQLGPVVEKIEAGLLGMQKVVGTSTHPKDLDAGLLAAALSVKSRCEQDVVLHLKYLSKLKALRMSELKKVMKGQAAQLQSIQDSLQTVKSKNKKIREQMLGLEAKSKVLSERSSTLLQASKDLRPSLTQADLHYFDLLKRMSAKCGVWEGKIHELVHSAETLAMQDQDDDSMLPHLAPLEAANVRVLLGSQKQMIDETQHNIQSTQEMVTDLVESTGVVTSDPYGDEL